MQIPEEPNKPESNTPRDSGLVAGLTLVGLGALLLLANVTDFRIGNWPAILMLLPGVLLLAQVVTVSMREGGIYRSVRPSLIGGLVLVSLGCITLFDLSVTTYWPLVLIAIGVGMTVARNPPPLR